MCSIHASAYTCAFANEFGEEGRDYFHAISQFYSGYDWQEADKKYDYALKGKYRRIGIGTFFAMSKFVIDLSNNHSLLSLKAMK